MKSDDAVKPVVTFHDALLLIDLQNDFLPGGALAVPAGDEVVTVANLLQPAFGLVVATRDWHPADHMSFAASHPGRQPGDIVTIDGLSQILWPTHCVQGSHGAELTTELAEHPGRQEVFKGQEARIDSYSGFFDNGHRRETELHSLLSGQRVSRLFLMGLATDYCVKFTACDAVELDYDVYLIEDGCRGVELQAGDTERAIRLMRQRGVTVVQSAEVRSILREIKRTGP